MNDNRMMTGLWKLVALISVLLVIFLIGCSGSDVNPVSPVESNENPVTERDSKSQRILWGIWIFNYDPVQTEVTITPSRNALAHFNITDWLLPPNCDDCFAVVVNSFDPVTRILDADVTLKNPTHLSAYDVRGILYTNDYGHLLKNTDGWTALWEMPGGDDINQFKAFAKTEANRIFIPDGEHIENYRIYIPEPPNWHQITFAVDASWPGNCKEPYAFENFIQDDIFNIVGSSGSISIDVLDWQDDVDSVILEAPEFTGEASTPMTHTGGNTWSVELVNSNGLLSGTYPAKITVTSTNSGELALYNIIDITISDAVPIDEPVDVTPPSLSFHPVDIVMDGDYAYIAGYETGLHIVDISDPSNPVWVKNVEMPYWAMDVAVSNGYAYLYCSGEGIQVVDVSPPEDASIVHTVDIEGPMPMDCTLSGNYAYMLAGNNGKDLVVLDIATPETAYVLNTLTLPYRLEYIDIDGNYAYIFGDDQYGNRLTIVDISTPGSEYVENTLGMGGNNRNDLAVNDGYAYIVTAVDDLTIVDVDPPAAMAVVNQVEFPLDMAEGVSVSDNLAYVAGAAGSVYIVELDLPGSAEIINTVELPQNALKISTGNGYACVIDHFGLYVLDIDPAVTAEVIASVYTSSNAYGVDVAEDYAYVADYLGKLLIADISSPESPVFVKLVDINASGLDVLVKDGYAYVATNDWPGTGETPAIRIIDVDPVETAHVVHTVFLETTTYFGAEDIKIVGDHLYVANHVNGLQVIDISDPETAAIIKTVETPEYNTAHGVAVTDGYAYLSDWSNTMSVFLRIIDIDPLGDASIINSVEIPDASYASCIDTANGYVYVPVTTDGLYIVEVNPPGDPQIVGSTAVGGIDDIIVNGGFAYLARGHGFSLVDVDPPEEPVLLYHTSTNSDSLDVAIQGDYAFLASNRAGLRIIKVW